MIIFIFCLQILEKIICFSLLIFPFLSWFLFCSIVFSLILGFFEKWFITFFRKKLVFVYKIHAYTWFDELGREQGILRKRFLIDFFVNIIFLNVRSLHILVISSLLNNSLKSMVLIFMIFYKIFLFYSRWCVDCD